MLFEIINGTLGYRIPVDTDDNQFNELAGLLNELTEKIQKAGYLNPYLSTEKIKEAIKPAVLIQKVQDYILNHLEEALPSTKELAQMFGTNDFTLKQSFRDLFETSIYQFYNEERLKKARLLIEKTAIPLGNIALLAGFNNYSNFFKAFKKKFNQSPSDITRRPSKNLNSDLDSNILN